MVSTPGRSTGLEVQVSTDGTDTAISNLGAVADKAKSVGSAVTIMGGALGAAAAGGLAAASAQASKFQDSMVELQKVTSAETMEGMNGPILEMSENIPLAQDKLADLAAQAGRFGIRGRENLESFTEASAKMAFATDVGASEAGENFARLATLTQMPISEAENLGSSINALSNNFATSSSEITDSALRSAGALRQLGVSKQDIYGVSAAVNAASESSERAGSRLRRLAQEMLSPSARARKKLLPALEMTWDQFVKLRNKNPVGMMKRLARMLGEGGDKADQLRQGLSTTSEQALAALGANLEDVDRATKLANSSWEEATSLQKEFSAQMDTVSSQSDILINKFRGIAIVIGQRMLPGITSTLKATNKVVGAFSAWNRANEGLYAKAILTSTAIVGLGAAASGLAGALGVSAAGAAGVLLTALGTLLVPIAALSAAFVAFEKDLFGVRTATENVAATVSAKLTTKLQALAGTVKRVGSAFRTAWGATFGDPRTYEVVPVLLDGVRLSVASTLQGINALVRGDASAFRNAWQGFMMGARTAAKQGILLLEDLFREGAMTILLTFREAFDLKKGVYGSLRSASIAVSAVLSSILLNVTGFESESKARWDRAVRGWSYAVETGMPLIRSAVSGGVRSIQSQVERFTTAVRNAWSVLWPYFPQPVQQALGEVLRAWTVHATPLLNEARGLANTLPAIARQVGAGVRSAFAGEFKLAELAVRQSLGLIHDATSADLRGLDRLVEGNLSRILTRWDSHRQTVVSAVDLMGTQLRGGAKAALAGFRAVIRRDTGHAVLLFRIALGQAENAVLNGLNAIDEITGTKLQETAVRWIRHGKEILGRARTAYGLARHAVSKAITRVRGAVSSALSFVTGVWEKHGQSVLSKVRLAYRQVRSFIGGSIQNVWQTAQGVLGSLQGLWNRHQAAVTGAINRIVTPIVNLAKRFGLLDQQGRLTASGFASIASTILTVLVPPLGMAVGAAQKLWFVWKNDIGGIQGLTQRVFAGVKRFIQQAMPVVRQVIQKSLYAVRRIWNNVLAPLGTAAMRIFRTVTRSVQQNMPLIKSTITEYLLSIRATWNNVLKPLLKVAIGVFIGVLRTVDKNLPLVKATIQRATTAIIRIWNTTIEPLLTTALRVFRGVSKAVRTNLPRAKRLVRQAVVAIGTLWNQHIKPLWTTAKRIFKQISSTVSSETNRTRSTIQRVLSRVKSIWNSRIKPLLTTAQRTFSRIRSAISTAINFVRNRVIGPFVSWAIGQWREHGRSIMGEVRETFDSIRSKVQTVLNFVRNSIIKPFVSLVTGIWQRYGDDIQRIAEQSFEAARKAIDLAIGAIRVVIETTIGAIQTAWELWGDELSTFAETTFEGIKGTVEWLLELLRLTIETALNLIQGDWEDIISDLQTFAEDTFEGIKSFVVEWGPKILSALGSILSDLLQKFKDLKNDGVEQISNLAGTVMDYLTGKKGPLSDVRSAGKALVDSFVDGILDAPNAVKNAVKDVVGKARDFLPFSPAKKGPLSDLDRVGPAFVNTIADGINSNLSVIQRAAQNLVKEFSWVKSEANNAMNAARNVGGGRSRPGSGLGRKATQRAKRRERALIRQGEIGSGIDWHGLRNQYFSFVPKRMQGSAFDFIGQVFDEQGRASAVRAMKYLSNNPGLGSMPYGRKFAEGGVVTSATPGIFGEAGPEAVMPLDKLDSMLSATALAAGQPRGQRPIVIETNDSFEVGIDASGEDIDEESLVELVEERIDKILSDRERNLLRKIRRENPGILRDLLGLR